MKIEFKTLRFKNVLSYGNKISEYNFENGIDLVVGGNGLGKSTFVDALTYCLFGKPFRKIKIGSLINNKNNRELWVEAEFSANGNSFKVIRGQKPDIFEIYKKEEDGYSLVEKPSTNRDYQALFEDSILKFGENVYRQLIALGANLSSSKNFMDLNKSEKEEVLQIITDTAIFNQIKDKVREEKLLQKTYLTEYEYKVEVLSSSISSTKFNIKAMEKQNEEFNANRDSILKELRQELEESEEKLKKYPSAISKLEQLESEINEMLPQITSIESELVSVLEKEQDVKAKVRRISANEKNKVVCPNCEFEIKEELPYTSEELKVQLVYIIEERDRLQNELNELLEERKQKQSKVLNKDRLNKNMVQLEDHIKTIKERIEKTEAWEAVKIDYSELEQLERDYEEAKNRLIKIKQDMTELIELEDMVSDKNLKGVILNQQLPFLNKYINEFLELFDSKFNFVIDSEFNEKIISRNSDNDFNSLSNGQKQRISLSILFAFLKLIEEKNGISTNLLILDEYLDSSLDIEGIDEVMTILDEVFSSSKNVVLISHNPDIKNRLEILNRIVKVSVEDGFSKFEIEKS